MKNIFLKTKRKYGILTQLVIQQKELHHETLATKIWIK